MSTLAALESKPEYSPKSIARAIWKQKLAGLAVVAIMSGIGVGVSRHLPSMYRAEALVLVDPQKIPERFVAATVSQNFADRLATMSQEILSASRLRAIIAEFNLYPQQRKTMVLEEVVEQMRKDIEIKVDKNASDDRPGAFRILYVATDPAIAARVVNRITDFYIRENLQYRENQSEGTAAFLGSQLKDAQTALDREEVSVSNYKRAHGGELPGQENMLLVTAGRLQVELQGNQAATDRLNQDRVARRGSLVAANEAESVALKRLIGKTNASTAPGQRPVRQSESLRIQLDAARTRYNDQHPDVKRLKYQYDQALSREAETGAASSFDSGSVSLGSTSTAQDRSSELESDPEVLRLHGNVVVARANLEETERELALREAERGRLERDLDNYQRRIEQLPVREQEMASLTRDYDFSKSNYRSLLDKKIAADMATNLEKRQEAERFKILDPARPPEKPFKPKRQLLYAGSVIGGLILGMLLAVGLEFRKGVLLGRWELPASVPVLGHVSRIEATAGERRLFSQSGLAQRIMPSIVKPVLLIMVMRGYLIFFRWLA